MAEIPAPEAMHHAFVILFYFIFFAAAVASPYCLQIKSTIASNLMRERGTDRRGVGAVAHNLTTAFV